MAYVEQEEVVIETDSSGDGTGYTSVGNGKVINVVYTKATSSPYDAGVDFTITAEDTGITIWEEDSVDASKTVCPRQATHDKGGTEQNTSGDVKLGDIYLANERVKIVIANGGDTKTGTFTVLVGG